MLKLLISRGPLSEHLGQAILDGYTRLTSATVKPENFRRWIEQSPGGPALHALLMAEDDTLAGHCCLFPLPMKAGGQRIIAAKAEYFFVKPEFRKEHVSGYENTGKPAALLLLEQLYRCGSDAGWEPYLVSAPPEVAPLHRLAGCRKISISLTECLLTLRPLRAAAHTPNLSFTQRVALGGAGVVQRAFSGFRRSSEPGIRSVPFCAPFVDGAASPGFSLSCDPDFLDWRYPASEYFRWRTESQDVEVIAKRGSRSEYLRVCQLSPGGDERCWKALLRALTKTALEDRALGVRCAIYNGSAAGDHLISLLKKMAFLCVSRDRTIYVQCRDPANLKSSAWRLQDALFCFDS